MRIGAAASQVGVSTGYIRTLERAGKIPPPMRDANGCRRYSDDDLARLRAILYGRKSTAQREDTR